MFFDRYDAGKQLAQKLISYKSSDTVVYALPRGGVLVGYEIAKSLKAPLDVVINRKIGHPLNKECAICAITEEGEMVYDELGLCGIDDDWINIEATAQQKEARRRRFVYKDNQPSISAEGKTAILVDDGIATGLTMKAAIKTIEKQKPTKIIVAVPVAPHEVINKLNKIVDETVVLLEEKSFQGAVGAYYRYFPEVFDKEVQVCLKKANKRKRKVSEKSYKFNPKVICT